MLMRSVCAAWEGRRDGLPLSTGACLPRGDRPLLMMCQHFSGHQIRIEGSRIVHTRLRRLPMLTPAGDGVAETTGAGGRAGSRAPLPPCQGVRGCLNAVDLRHSFMGAYSIEAFLY